MFNDAFIDMVLEQFEASSSDLLMFVMGISHSGYRFLTEQNSL